MKKHKIVLLLFLSIWLLTSCDGNKIYESNVEIPKGSWDIEHVAQFKFAIEDTKIPYNLKVNVRNTEFYMSQNLWVFIKTTSPSSKVQYDTLNCLLANDKGEWLGEGMGDIWDLSVPYKQSIGFPEKGQYTVEIKHGMRMQKVPMIMEIGLRVEKAEIEEKD